MSDSNWYWLPLLTIGPLLLVGLTSFVKISVVLTALRNALGTNELPSTLVLTALAMVLTAFTMAPVAMEVATRLQQDATAAPQGLAVPPPSKPAAPLAPPASGTAPATGAGPGWLDVVPAPHQPMVRKLDAAVAPLRAFLAKHAGATEVTAMRKLAKPEVHRDELWVLAPAFLLTELKAAFAIAVMVLLPFLLIDVLVAVGLAAVGLPSMSSNQLALPLKLLLFVAVDAWRLVTQALVGSYT